MVSLWSDLEADEFDFEWDIRLGDLARPVKQAKAAMTHADLDRSRRDEAIKRLTEAGVNYRDVNRARARRLRYSGATRTPRGCGLCLLEPRSPGAAGVLPRAFHPCANI